MKKSKLSAGILTGLLAVGALAACSKSGPTYNSDGVILTYEVNGKKIEYTADDLFKTNVRNAEHAEEMFNQVYKLVVRNYFTIKNPDGEGTNTGSEQMAEINRIAEKNVKIDKDTAEKNSKTNSTSYNTEFENILKSKGCENEEELKAYYVFEEQQTKFKENFYKIYADEDNSLYSDGFNLLRDGSSSANEDTTKNPDKYSGYLETKVPYHVSHILVNVEDGASTNYWNGTVSVSNVERLKNVIDGLEDESQNFGQVAYDWSEDGSKSDYGDLGIVDKDKATEQSDKFVKEFILGLYTYDNKYNPSTVVQNRVKASTIRPSDTVLDLLPEEPRYLERSYFNDLYNYREVEKVLDTSSSENFYPRNIIYNNYFNNHEVSVIVDGSAEHGNYKVFNFGSGNKAVLCAKGTSNPILVTRAGASYQGIHFITVNRSPFEGELPSGKEDVLRNYTTKYTQKVAGEDKEISVSLAQYYTTKTPDQKAYPTQTVTVGGTDYKIPLRTYVNPVNYEKSKYTERADKVLEEVKSFDTNIERFIYTKYIKGQLKFVGEGEEVGKTIDNWIARRGQENIKTTFDSWEEYWTDYADMLAMQKEQEPKRLKRGCAIAYNRASLMKTQKALNDLRWNKDTLEPESDGVPTTDTIVNFDQLFNENGGACNDGKSHK